MRLTSANTEFFIFGLFSIYSFVLFDRGEKAVKSEASPADPTKASCPLFSQPQPPAAFTQLFPAFVKSPEFLSAQSVSLEIRWFRPFANVFFNVFFCIVPFFPRGPSSFPLVFSVPDFVLWNSLVYHVGARSPPLPSTMRGLFSSIGYPPKCAPADMSTCPRAVYSSPRLFPASGSIVTTFLLLLFLTRYGLFTWLNRAIVSGPNSHFCRKAGGRLESIQYVPGSYVDFGGARSRGHPKSFPIPLLL